MTLGKAKITSEGWWDHLPGHHHHTAASLERLNDNCGPGETDGRGRKKKSRGKNEKEKQKQKEAKTIKTPVIKWG